MTATLPLSLERLARFLAGNGGCERFEFHDGFGQPDPLGARAFAERLREQLGDQLDQLASVRQTAHRVTVSLLEQPAAH